MTVHEVKGDSTLRELYKASGGAWGGTRVDEAYMDMYGRILGTDVLEDFRNKHRVNLEFL